MIPDKVYPSLSVKRINSGTGLDEDIPNLILAADDRRVHKVDMSIDGTQAAPYFSASQSFRMLVPGLRGAPTTFPDKRRTMIRRVHGELPSEHLRLMIGREDAYTADAPAGAAAMTPGGGVPDPFEEQIDSALADHVNPFYQFQDAANGIVGVWKLQLEKLNADPIAAYDAALDVGNAGNMVFQIDVPYTVGLASGLPTETAPETTNSGPTQILLRRRQGPSQTNPNPWFCVGCLASEKEEARLREYAEQMKGYSDIVVSRTLKRNLPTFNCNSSGDTAFLAKQMNAGTYEQFEHMIRVAPAYGGYLEEFECVLQTRSAAGRMHWIYCPSVNFTDNGSTTHGGTEKQIPFTISGNEPGYDDFSHCLYQSTFLAVGIIVTN